ncbi:MAG TPA: SET domain-containing protein [Bacteroidia bacterium]|nr:SET domain-containing protein [Bacteroidia bacterium]
MQSQTLSKPDWAVLGQYVGAPPDPPSGIIAQSCELGMGLFATRTFAPDETIFWFTGKMIDSAEVKSRGIAAGYPLQVDEDLFIDVGWPGLFVNHSCEPNAGLRDHRRLVALRPIDIGEEIRFDYSTEISGHWWTLQCRCGATNCRGQIADFDQLPPEVQAERLRQGIVQPYIVRLLSEKATVA